METSPRIIFMGTPDFAVATLDCLVKNKYTIAAVVTAPDKPAGRGLKIQSSAVKNYAIENGLKVLQPINLKDESFITEIKNLNADIQIVVAFRMLPVAIWSIPKLGTINLHGSLLPQYRGAAPINWAIINGEHKTGVTTFFINEHIDTGDILLQEEIHINPDDTAGDLHDRMMVVGAELVLKTVQSICSSTTTGIKQTSIIQKAEPLNPAPKLNKEDGRINWHQPLNTIYNMIRGLSPFPCAFTEFKTPSGQLHYIEIYKCLAIHQEGLNEAGTILTDNKTYIHIVTQGGLIDLQEIQLTGRKKMDISSFLRGFQVEKGSVANTISPQ